MTPRVHSPRSSEFGSMRSSHVHALHHGAQKEDTRRPCHSRQHNSGVQPRRGMRRRGRRRARCARGAVRATPDTRQRPRCPRDA
eukprot:scaffold61289_cov64-Phaeocystis_antarctica.AAC.3